MLKVALSPALQYLVLSKIDNECTCISRFVNVTPTRYMFSLSNRPQAAEELAEELVKDFAARAKAEAQRTVEERRRSARDKSDD